MRNDNSTVVDNPQMSLESTNPGGFKVKTKQKYSFTKSGNTNYQLLFILENVESFSFIDVFVMLKNMLRVTQIYGKLG